MTNILKGTRLCYPKIYLFGIRIIILARPLRTSRCRKSSKSRTQVFLLSRKCTLMRDIFICQSCLPLPTRKKRTFNNSYQWRRYQLKSSQQTLLNNPRSPYFSWSLSHHFPSLPGSLEPFSLCLAYDCI